MIKSSKSLISQAAAALTADRRWCLTGTPIQVSFIVDLMLHCIN
jgi:SNF2 family DNA or RNA helicase